MNIASNSQPAPGPFSHPRPRKSSAALKHRGQLPLPKSTFNFDEALRFGTRILQTETDFVIESIRAGRTVEILWPTLSALAASGSQGQESLETALLRVIEAIREPEGSNQSPSPRPVHIHLPPTPSAPHVFRRLSPHLRHNSPANARGNQIPNQAEPIIGNFPDDSQPHASGPIQITVAYYGEEAALRANRGTWSPAEALSLIRVLHTCGWPVQIKPAPVDKFPGWQNDWQAALQLLKRIQPQALPAL